MNFEYKGTEITIDSRNGSFTATINGAHVRKPSLDAMHKAIDRGMKKPFTEFTALSDRFGVHERATIKGIRTEEPGLVLVNVTGIQKTTNRYNTTGYEFLYTIGPEDRSRTAEILLVDSVENIDAYREHAEYADETRRIAKERELKQHELRERIQYHKAVDYYSAKKNGK